MRMLLVLFSVLFSSQIFAHTYIDATQLKITKETDKALDKQCGDLKAHYRQWTNCADKVYQLYPDRGSDEYSEAHYSHLSKTQADKTIKSLFAIYKKANASDYHHQEGEMTKNMASNEATWIQNHVFKRDANWPFTLWHGTALYPSPDEY